ncbi:MAG: sigma-70 family RNA polymerase sigma factor [Pirellula sp.]|jgi:RNA polymerase sigma factor (sigma-70 family)|nr:sigma-70 family RNA polymerase sigma factor [Pirellula sp.]
MPINPLDFSGTFRRATDGDHYATLELLEHFRLKLTHDLETEIHPRLKTRFSLADVLQEMSLQLLARKNPQLSPRKRKSTGSTSDSSRGAYRWIRKLIIRRIIDLYRRHMGTKMRDARRELSLSQLEQSGSETGRSIDRPCVFVLQPPSERLRDYETRCVVQNAIYRLSPIYRDVILLKFYDGLSTPEIAQRLHLSDATVAKRFRRGIEKLKECSAIKNLV